MGRPSLTVEGRTAAYKKRFQQKKEYQRAYRKEGKMLSKKLCNTSTI
jgi:hypothetical protein